MFLSTLQADTPTPYPDGKAGNGTEHLPKMGKTTVVEKQSTNGALRVGALRMWNEMKQNWAHFLFRSLMAGFAAATAADVRVKTASCASP